MDDRRDASETRSPRRSPACAALDLPAAGRRRARPARPAGPARRPPGRCGGARSRGTRDGLIGRSAGSTSTSRTITSDTRVSSYGSIAVFAGDVLAAPGDLLGQDRALEQQHGHRIGGRRGGEQRRQHMRRRRSARRRTARRSAARASCRPASRPCRAAPRSPASPGQARPDQPAHGAAEDQQRRQHAARRAGRQRDEPDHRLDQQDRQHRLRRRDGPCSRSPMTS